MGKRVKLGNFWGTITSYEEIWQEIDERERLFQADVVGWRRKKKLDELFDLRPKADEQAESGNFSEEEKHPNADEGLVRWIFFACRFEVSLVNLSLQSFR